MRPLTTVRVGDGEPPRRRDRLGALAVAAATLIGALLITDDVESAVTAVTALVGLVR